VGSKCVRGKEACNLERGNIFHAVLPYIKILFETVFDACFQYNWFEVQPWPMRTPRQEESEEPLGANKWSGMGQHYQGEGQVAIISVV
jgi:hypothetical protein